MEINERILKVQGTATLSEALELGKQYEIHLQAECRGDDPRINDDGTCNKIYPVKLISAELISETGRSIKAKSRGSQSKVQRYRMIKWGHENFPDMDEELVYQKMEAALLHEDRLERILDRLKPLVE